MIFCPLIGTHGNGEIGGTETVVIFVIGDFVVTQNRVFGQYAIQGTGLAGCALTER